MDTWAEQLAGLTGEQIQNGLKNLPKDFPPTPMQFKDLCIGQNEHNTKAYKPFDRSKALELKADKEKARKHLSEIKQKLGMTA
ncbi:MAG TPA: hypothetical protein ENI26_02070 [Methylophaga aminisulfidivorans]|uniref:Uncharacterized protein n=2 Tax=root TaxID=1 RepID=A0A7C1VQC5_9GAMM|nr:hypothetical protein [Methylophaga aminisulfidivorans]